MKRSRILLVEDEVDLAEPIIQGLREEGFEVKHAPDGQRARRYLAHHWDLVILDLMLPDLPGEAVLDFIRQSSSYPAVLILTARAAINDKLSLFRRGCDDFLTKPFCFDELVVRVRALLRRPSRVVLKSLKYEDLELDSATHRLSTEHAYTILTPIESSICELFFTERGRVVSRREILQGVWGVYEEPNSDLVGIHIFNLRKKMAEIGRESWLQTVRNNGFLLGRPDSIPDDS